jgi:hypothetical protein
MDSRPCRSAALSLAGLCLFALLGFPAAPAFSDTQYPKLSGGWYLLRSANPRGGPDAVSVSHTADGSRSDLDLAGLMLRCGDHGAAEVVVVAVTPLPPRARPDVFIHADGKQWQFSADVVPPGAELLLPADAAILAAGPWQLVHELEVQVRSPEQSFGGVVPIDGLSDALATLKANCPAG